MSPKHLPAARVGPSLCEEMLHLLHDKVSLYHQLQCCTKGVTPGRDSCITRMPEQGQAYLHNDNHLSPTSLVVR